MNLDTCGCCEGTEVITPIPIVNRPGLSALDYRIGTHATFLETMLARLSALGIPLKELGIPLSATDDPESLIYPLRGLTTRSTDDPAVAFLDAWAIVTDILTFYQERIANEGYLPTATERRSILQLARLVGYTLRPGVASSVFLAYTLEDGHDTTIPAGSRAQSLPGPGQLPQSFETSVDLAARSKWNNLQPRASIPQHVALIKIFVQGEDTTKDPARLTLLDTDTTDGAVLLQGTGTGLKKNSAVLFVFSEKPGEQIFSHTLTVEPNAAKKYTRVTFAPDLMPLVFLRAIRQIVERYLDLATFGITANDPHVSSVVQALQDGDKQLSVILSQTVPPDVAIALVFLIQLHALLKALAVIIILYIEQWCPLYDQAVKDGATGPADWLAGLITDLKESISRIPLPPSVASIESDLCTPTATASLGLLVRQLTKPPSSPPVDAIQLQRDVTKVFARKGDIVPQLIKALNPTITTTFYDAYANADVTVNPPLKSFYAFRVKASAFGHNALCQQTSFTSGIYTYKEWNLVSTDTDQYALYLDAVYDQIVPESWVAIEYVATPDQAGESSVVRINALQVCKVKQVDTLSRSDYGPSTKVTRLTFYQPWFAYQPGQEGESIPLSLLRGLTIYAQSEEMELAEQVLDEDVQGSDVELDDLYDGLQSGRWAIVSGERTDVPNTAGVRTGELVMLASVTQDVRQARAIPQPGTSPFPSAPNPGGQPGGSTGPQHGATPQVQPEAQVQEPAAASSEAQTSHEEGQEPAAASSEAQVPHEEAQASTGGEALPPQLPPEEGAISVSPIGAGTRLERLLGASLPPEILQRAQVAINNPPPSDGQSPGNLPGDKVHTFLHFAAPLQYTYKRDTVQIAGNVVHATHGETQNEVLGSGDGSKSMQRFTLRKSPLTYVSAIASTGIESTLAVRVNDILWHETDNLDAASPKDRTYITQADDQAKTTIIFGNGTHGARLPTGPENVKAVYRVGIGKPGNVDTGQISLLATRPLGVKGVNNPLPAAGGADKESRDQGRRNVPLATLSLDRIVSTQDYADFARTFAGIGKASAINLPLGRQQLVHLTIAGLDNIPITKTSDLYLNLFQTLRQFGNPSTPLRVDIAEVKLLVISAQIRILPDYKLEFVAPNIRTALYTAFGFEQRDLGQTVYQSEVLSVIQGVPGVAYVDLALMDAIDQQTLLDALNTIHAEELQEANTGQQPANPTADLTALLGLDTPNYVEAQLARPDPTADGGVAPAQLVFLDADVPDTLILTELN
ncbi:MAG: hypothetical protein NVSMB27_00410 [Ktedonobacteraceae bacterium]